MIGDIPPMTVREIARILEAEVLSGEELLDTTNVVSACGADMMSEVLAFSKGNSVLLTGLTNQQTVRTAEMMDILCLTYVRGKRPDAAVIELARSTGILILATRFNMYHACGLLFQAGLPSGDMKE